MNGRTEELRRLINQPFKAEDAIHLIRLGADSSVKRDDGDTLLHRLALNMQKISNKTEITTLVTKLNVDINMGNGEGKTPLQRLMSQPFSTDNAMHLIHLGADASVKDDNGHTVLHRLVGQMHNLPENKEAILELVTHYVDINIKNENGQTPLEWLTSRSAFRFEDAIYLMRLGAKGNAKSIAAMQNKKPDFSLKQCSFWLNTADRLTKNLMEKDKAYDGREVIRLTTFGSSTA